MAKIFKNDAGRKFLFFTNYKVMYCNLGKILRRQFPGLKVLFSLGNVRDLDAYAKLAVVRNPYDRLVSLFFDKCREHPKRVRNRQDRVFLQTSQAQILKTGAAMTGAKTDVVEPGKEISLNSPEHEVFLANLAALESLGFPDFLRIVKALFTSPSMDAHFVPQSKIMTRENALVVDKVFKLETIKEAWGEICRFLDIQVELTEGMNRTNFEGPDKYKSFYTEEMKKEAYLLYKTDFDHFGYAE